MQRMSHIGVREKGISCACHTLEDNPSREALCPCTSEGLL